MRQRIARCFGKSSLSVLVAVAGAFLAWGVSGPVSAEMISIQVEAVAGGESAQYEWLIPKVLDASGHLTWQLPSPMVLTGPGGAIGTVQALTVGFDGDPGVSLNFVVAAGAVPTTFTLTSAVVSFASLLNPAAFATAGTTLTDTNSDGALLTGLYDGKVYKAMYDNNPVVDWAFLVDSSSASADDTVVTTERQPGAGRTTIFAGVYQIQSEFSFELSAEDQASGTSRFDVQLIPEPAAVGLVGTGLLTLIGVIRRRRVR